MVRTTVQIISGGRVTISRPIRDMLDVEEGDLIELEVRAIDGGDP